MTRSCSLLLALIVLAIAPAVASAQVYRWVDEKGVTHYGENPGAKSAKPVELNDPTGASKPQQPAQADNRSQSASPYGARPGETDLQRQEREFQERQKAREARIDADRRANDRHASSTSAGSSTTSTRTRVVIRPHKDKTTQKKEKQGTTTTSSKKTSTAKMK
jgi:hypothetical protein